jgi:hypothetical protein
MVKPNDIIDLFKKNDTVIPAYFLLLTTQFIVFLLVQWIACPNWTPWEILGIWGLFVLELAGGIRMIALEQKEGAQ